MFGWLKKKEEEPIAFPDVRSAFAFACEKLENPVRLEATIPAVVEERGRNGAEGERQFLLRLAAPGGGREIWGCTLKEATSWPEVGDLVGFRVVTIAPDLPEGMNLIGFIACGLDPVYLPGRGWRIARNYTPSNIRQTVRW